MTDKKFKMYVMGFMVAWLVERAFYYLYTYNKVFDWLDYIIERVLELSR